MTRPVTGPLAGIKVLELQGMGPGPFCAMLLGDYGADVVRVERTASVRAAAGPPPPDVLARGRRSVGIDLKTPGGIDALLRLVERADVLIEGFRPGVTERLGIGPDVCLARNPRLVYGRITGWGQAGPYAPYAGHDINYLALSGSLWSIGRDGEAPVAPLTYVGDFGGGGMLLTVGICAALAERASSGRGQVVDAAMVDGAALLNSFLYGMRAMGLWGEERGRNMLDTGAPYYDTYETADGKWISVGALEPHFYRNLLDALGLDDLPRTQPGPDGWPALRARFAAVFRTRTRDEWSAALEAAEACFAPVLSPWEAPEHPHNAVRETFVAHDGLVQPAPAPRFSRTPARIAGPVPSPGQHTGEVLAEWGFAAEDIEKLRAAGDIA
ncbi:CaiB/BaiF CoA transferase family protein [Dactylosporangium sucinum]|uniref:Alpha-methylacyl-CoA racemase n=1 Tax=Dactylosporangium sucinum TaxID=1424081 RepID=A0A917UCS1_9ACTN|nr:CaiB/BaiF CoA-transferase family protein [Dactylosporangium sucinum]GGM75211.1 alpha-methylacyl-CoA racemase [Dactylosporangium sucinum]